MNYSKDLEPCSDFCNFVMKFFDKYQNIKYILDAGSGNGRDSFTLSSKYKVDAVDNSGFIPKNTKQNLTFLTDDFVNINKNKYDLIYSRFTFHSISNEQHLTFLNTIKTSSYLAIEARSIKSKDILPVHGISHYRNYIDLEYLKNILSQNNFEIIYIIEDQDLAIYKTENPYCIRVICKKLESS